MEEHNQHAEGKPDSEHRSDSRDEIYSKVIRAGKRTYFFDIKATRAQDFYLTITESKKRFNRDGRFFYEKHKLFLYKEDFDKFTDAMEEVLAKIAELRANFEAEQGTEESLQAEPAPHEAPNSPAPEEVATTAASDASFTEVSFEDLGSSEIE